LHDHVDLCLTLAAFCLLSSALGDVVLSETIMNLALAAAKLSSLAIQEDPPGEGFDSNPYFVTFGQPATVNVPCRLISSELWFRFVNFTKASDVGIAYDPIPFAPGMGASYFGHMILLGEDSIDVAYVGLDANDAFGPLCRQFLV
jgi:hypothetical protein